MIDILDGYEPGTSSSERLENQSSSSVLSGDGCEMPTSKEVVDHGFSQSFIDAEWERIYRTEQMDIWISQLGHNFPFLHR